LGLQGLLADYVSDVLPVLFDKSPNDLVFIDVKVGLGGINHHGSFVVAVALDNPVVNDHLFTAAVLGRLIGPSNAHSDNLLRSRASSNRRL